MSKDTKDGSTRAEGEYIEAVREEISVLVADIPSGVADFIDWFEELRETGPGQGDPLFPWLAEVASRDRIRSRYGAHQFCGVGIGSLRRMAVRVILPVGVFNPNKPGVPETAGPIRISEAIVTSSVALMCFISRITLAKTISSSA